MLIVQQKKTNRKNIQWKWMCQHFFIIRYVSYADKKKYGEELIDFVNLITFVEADLVGWRDINTLYSMDPLVNNLSWK